MKYPSAVLSDEQLVKLSEITKVEPRSIKDIEQVVLAAIYNNTLNFVPTDSELFYVKAVAKIEESEITNLIVMIDNVVNEETEYNEYVHNKTEEYLRDALENYFEGIAIVELGYYNIVATVSYLNREDFKALTIVNPPVIRRIN